MTSQELSPPRSTVDLHVHTNASDGQYSPAETVRRALELGLTVIAITDHDTTDGLAEALAEARGIGLDVIPGVEISTDVKQAEVHILGYYVRHDDPALCERLSRCRAARLKGAQQMLAKLGRMGLPLEWKRVRQIAGPAPVGRPHIARAMVEKGYVSSIDEAFDRYIRRRGPAYVERDKVPPAEAVQMILAAGGLPVLAHPLYVSHLVEELAQHGLVGLEAYYTGYTADETRFLIELAQKYGLLVTGGTDFHGEQVQPGNLLGEVMVPTGVVDALRAYHRRHCVANRARVG